MNNAGNCRRKKLLLMTSLLMALCLTLGGCAQKYSVEGLVTDSFSQPIFGAKVTAQHSSGTSTCYTDYDGRFKLKLPEGPLKLQASKAGFAPQTASMTLGAVTAGLTFALQPSQDASASGRISFGTAAPAAGLSALSSPGARKVFPLERHPQTEAQYDGVLVQYRDGTTASAQSRWLARAGASEYHEARPGLYHIRTADPRGLLDRLRLDPNVRAAQLNYIHRMQAVPADEYYGLQWNMNLAQFPDAWDHVKGSDANVVVAVLDTGILPGAYTALDLSANLLPGYDAVDRTPDATDDVSLDYSHGTHVASTIAAVTNNTALLAGAGWNIKVLPVKVFTRVEGMFGAPEDAIVEGVYYAVDHGAKVINLSLGFHLYPDPADHPLLEAALQYADEHKVAVFAATGNDEDSYVSYPASSDYAFAVGAVGHDTTKAWYSNYGPELDLMAPGGSGEDPMAIDDWVIGYSGDEAIGLVGTSMATPHVAAVAGLLYTSGMTEPAEVYALLKSTATPAGDPLQYGSGLLNAGAAVHAALRSLITLENVQVCAATTLDGMTWTRMTASAAPNSLGDYLVSGIPASVPGVYIIAFIDRNGNGIIETGDYFGACRLGYTYGSGEHRSGINVQISVYGGSKPIRIR